MMNRLVSIVLLLSVSLGIGFFLGYFLSRGNTEVVTIERTASVRAPFPITVATGGSEESQPTLGFDQIADQATIFDKLMYAHVLADQSNIDELERYLNQAADNRDPLYNYNMVSIFLEKYTALDPTAAIQFVEDTPAIANQRFIAHIVTSWVRVDPEAAIDFYTSLDDQQLKSNLASRLLSDPTLRNTGFEDEIIASLGSGGRTMADYMSVRQLPPDMAFEEALNLAPKVRLGMLGHAASRWLKADPDQAIERILQHDNLEERTMLLQGILNDYVAIDEDAAFAFAQTHLTSNARLEQHMLSVLAQKNPQRTLPLVEDFISRTGNANPLNGVIATWIKQEPQAALAYVETLDSSLQETMLTSAAYSYVHSHPEEGFSWLLSQQDKHPTMVRNTIASSINHSSVQFAERSINQITDPNLKTQLIAGIGNYKASQNPEAALDWLEGYRTDPAYEAAVQNVITSMSYQNPRAAARALEGRLDDASATPLVGQIANNWYRASPKDAVAWVDSLSDGDAKSSALSNMAMMVAHQDPDEAKRIIRSLPEGEYRDNARRNVAFSMVQIRPEEVEAIISEYEVPEADARHMRELAKNRNQARAGLIQSFRTTPN